MRAVHLVLVSCLMAAGVATAIAQDYPSKPIRIVQTAAPGGPIDFISRTVGDRLSPRLGQPFIYESRPGANNRIGTEYAARSPGDGYTMVVIGVPHATNPSLFSSLPYDTLRDLTALVHLVNVPLVLVTAQTSSLRNVQDLVKLAREKPGEVTVGTAGNGTGPHLALELLGLVAGVSLTHVPYKGDAPAFTEAMAGRITASFNTLQAPLQQVKAGRLRPLGVASRERAAALPDTPTFAEQGFPDAVVTTWFGFAVPSATPREIVARLNSEINAVLAMDDVRERLTGAGLVPVGGSAEQFDGFIRSEMKRWAEVIKKRGIKAD